MLSDNMFYDELKDDNRHLKKKVSLDCVPEAVLSHQPLLEDDFILEEDKQKALSVAYELLEDASLTEIQKKRFIQYYFLNVSIRQIGKNEGRYMSSVQESLLAATKKLNMLFCELPPLIEVWASWEVSTFTS
ncbi:MAG: hypothetical protein ATN33_00820 [Epulopiscium sp. Nele67-Bin001]|nr:MAG: hypothetical protein ATN33_00820 [Epulopiscium sp. Nele67-Bin001]